MRSYLGRVTKAHILEAVLVGVGYGAAELIKDRKKQEMAEDAERLLAGSGWLPPLLRTERPARLDETQQAQTETEAETVADAPETAEPEDLTADAAEPASPEAEATEPAGPDAEEGMPTDAAEFAEPEEAPTLLDVPDPDAPEPEEIAPDMEDVEDGAAFYEAAE